MASTKQRIMDSFLKLLDERPLNRISIKDIVEDCGINRNTFYYHFEDMPSLVEAAVLEEAKQVMDRYDDISSLEQCYEAAMRLTLGHKRAVYHIYNSANREMLERNLMDICGYVVAKYIDGAIAGRPIRPEDRQIIIHSYQCECFGHVIDWLNHGMSDDVERQFIRLCELRRGSTEIMLERAVIV